MNDTSENETIHGFNECVDAAVATLGAKHFAIKCGYIFCHGEHIYWSLYGAMRKLGNELLNGADPKSAIEDWLMDTAQWVTPAHPQLTRLDEPVR